MAAALERLGFEVILALDLDKAAFDRSVRAFVAANGTFEAKRPGTLILKPAVG